jgi:uncharacterized protein (UPF0332 family)
MSEVNATISPMKELENQIRIARKALEEAERIEEEDGYDDAMLSMERTYCEGYVEALHYAYIILNGHELSDD